MILLLVLVNIVLMSFLVTREMRHARLRRDVHDQLAATLSSIREIARRISEDCAAVPAKAAAAIETLTNLQAQAEGAYREAIARVSLYAGNVCGAVERILEERR